MEKDRDISPYRYIVPSLMYTQVARLMTPTETSAPSLAASMTEMKYAVFFANWQPGVPKYNWVNWQWWVTQTKTETDIPTRNAHFQRRITDCSIVFQINKYVNLACFLHICKHIIVFLCFSRVKNLHIAPLKTDLLWAPGLLIECMCFCWTHLFALIQLIFKLVMFSKWKTILPMMLYRKFHQLESHSEQSSAHSLEAPQMNHVYV